MFLLLFVFLFACEKEMEIEVPQNEIKQLKIDFPSLTMSSSTESGTILDEMIYFNFNIGNYVNCDSIIFAGLINVQISGHTTCFLELYNLSDDVPIANSVISTEKTVPVWVLSQDILKEFPDKMIDLCLRLRVDQDEHYANVSAASLYVYFKEKQVSL